MSNDDLYLGREQTLVKHFILEHYLERFAIIVGTHWDTITYVDCFTGPWNVQSEDFKDSSFAIALEQLRKARKVHQERTGRTLKLRCFFLESNRSAFAKLKQFTEKISDVEIESQNKKLEDAIPPILEFVKKGGHQSFPFIFIDPKGWAGFAMSTIAPLLQLRPGEVLINFMTEHIRRFIDSPQEQTQASFIKLFGSGKFKTTLQGLERQDRVDALVGAYSENIKTTGRFGYTSTAIILHPGEDRPHFHLIYATRNLSGVATFKDVEKRAMSVMQNARGEAHKRKREQRTGQTEIFGGAAGHDPSYFIELRNRYTSLAKKLVLNLLRTTKQVAYDEAWALAMTVPLNWESDLKEWIRDWKDERLLEILGFQDKQRVPQRGKENKLVWNQKQELAGVSTQSEQII